MTSISSKEKIKIAKKNINKYGVNWLCQVLSISKSSLYYKPREKNDYELLIINLLENIHTSYPTYGSRRLTVEINQVLKELKLPIVNRKRIQRYMKILLIEVIYQKPNLSRLGKAEYIYPYLLKSIKITKPNQVWSCDITYIPYEKKFVYLFGIIDWYSRTIVGYEISTDLGNDFVIRTIENAIKKYGKPKIMNSDQGSHFTSKEYIEILKKNKIKISMDGHARALDNILIERFWRTIKYEYIFLRSYNSVKEIEVSIYNAVHHYNYYRPHQSLKYKYPMEIQKEKEFKKERELGNGYNLEYEPEYKIHEEMNLKIKEYKRGGLVEMLKKSDKKMKRKLSKKKVEKIFEKSLE